MGAALTPLQAVLRERQLTICAAESCTGGLICAALTELPGSSEYFLGGIVAYANDVKLAQLGVTEEALRHYGAVSAEVARQMALGARRRFGADLAVSVTGVAGPGADGPKPAGLTFIGCATEAALEVREYNWVGGRASNRASSVEAALALVIELLSRP